MDRFVADDSGADPEGRLGHGACEEVLEAGARDAGAVEPSLVEWRLARATSLLDPRWRPGEWDPAALTLTHDPDDPLVFGGWCRVVGCDVTTTARSGLCLGCSIRWREAGEPDVKA